MSQHSQRAQFGPSTAQVVVVGLSTAASSAGTAYVFTTPGFSVRELVACLMGATLAGLLAMHTLSLAADRAVARDRAERAAERERRETSAEHAELRSWQAAAAGLLDAYLSGRAVDFGGEPVPDYVRARLADVPPPEPEPTSPAYAGPYEDHAPLAPPTYPEPESRAWLRDPEEAAVYAEPEPAGWGPAERQAAAVLDRTVADYRQGTLDHAPEPPRPPMEPWDAFARPSRERPELASVPVPLPTREPGRALAEDPTWTGADTEVISRVRDEDETEVIERVR